MPSAPAQPLRPILAQMASDAARVASEVGCLARYRRADSGGGVGGLADDQLPIVRVIVAPGTGGRNATIFKMGMGRSVAPRGLGSGLVGPASSASRNRGLGRLATPASPRDGIVRTVSARGTIDLGETVVTGSGTLAVVRVAAVSEGDVFILPGSELGLPQVADLELRVTAPTADDVGFIVAEVAW
ncbi:MAG: hypothetical protein K2Q20_06560 [Phycisphaerales bacterium]|nr:hypothetical protein [Phycisphaerales bacterium]